jgi:hypothetical protein
MNMLLLLGFTIVGVILADWPWRSSYARLAGRWLRALLTLFLIYDLHTEAHVGIGRAWRRALSANDPVTSAAPAFPSFTPYASGVTTMRREAEKDMGGIDGHLWALVIVGVTPAFRFRRREPDQPMSSPSTSAA